MARTLDSQHRERIYAGFAGQGLMSHIGARLGDLETGRCEVILPWRSAVGQQHGFFHGGVIGAIADAAAGFASYTLLPQDSTGLTAEYKINFLRPAKGDHLSARAEVVRAGRSWRYAGPMSMRLAARTKPFARPHCRPWRGLIWIRVAKRMHNRTKDMI